MTDVAGVRSPYWEGEVYPPVAGNGPPVIYILPVGGGEYPEVGAEGGDCYTKVYSAAIPISVVAGYSTGFAVPGGPDQGSGNQGVG